MRREKRRISTKDHQKRSGRNMAFLIFNENPDVTCSLFPVQNHCSLAELNQPTSHNASCYVNNAELLLPHSLAKFCRCAGTLKSICYGSTCSY